MYNYTHFIPENVAPSGAKKIGVYDASGRRIGSIGLGNLARPNATKLYSFCAISDPHITYDTANKDFQRALQYVEDTDCAFTCICGDLTSDGSDTQLELYQSLASLNKQRKKPIYAIGGNHETCTGEHMTQERLVPYTGHGLYYSFTQGNDVFIMVGHYGKDYKSGGGDWRNNEFVSVDELKWLHQTLEANRDKRCFIFNHVYPYQHRVGDADRLYDKVYWDTEDGEKGKIGQAFIELLTHYKNTILFHGHTHLRLALQVEDEKANYAYVTVGDSGYRSVHIPSLSVPRDKGADGNRTDVYSESEGYIVDVYDDCIVLNGRDFANNDGDRNHWIPIATYKIDTTFPEIAPNTFKDSTGTITT